MTWMAPIPTFDTRLPVHWVRDGTEYIPTGHSYRGTFSPGGWPAACDAFTTRIDDEPPPDRRVCRECAEVADYPYPTSEDDNAADQ